MTARYWTGIAFAGSKEAFCTGKRAKAFTERTLPQKAAGSGNPVSRITPFYKSFRFFKNVYEKYSFIL
jgi:hypothetical protein